MINLNGAQPGFFSDPLGRIYVTAFASFISNSP
jgi:hypothetical protein